MRIGGWSLYDLLAALRADARGEMPRGAAYYADRDATPSDWADAAVLTDDAALRIECERRAGVAS